MFSLGRGRGEGLRKKREGTKGEKGREERGQRERGKRGGVR